MSLRGKEVRPLIDEALHERLCLIAEFEGHDIAILAAKFLEKAIVGEWLKYDRLLVRARDLAEPERPEPTERNAGFVYVIRIGERYKIGKSSDWQKRLSSAMFPEPPEVICIIETDDRHRLERELHARYGDARLHGEWFGLKEPHVAELLKFPGKVSA